MRVLQQSVNLRQRAAPPDTAAGCELEAGAAPPDTGPVGNLLLGFQNFEKHNSVVYKLPSSVCDSRAGGLRQGERVKRAFEQGNSRDLEL